MKKSFPKINLRDGASGFFGWVILGNLALLLLLFLYFGSRTSSVRINGVTISHIISLSTSIAILVLFLKKRIWAGIGVILAFIVNLGLWMAFLQLMFSPSFADTIYFAGFPLPLGLIIGAIH